MSYLEKCLKEHIAGMEARQKILRMEIEIKKAELLTLEKETIDLSIGLDNWVEEGKS